MKHAFSFNFVLCRGLGGDATILHHQCANTQVQKPIWAVIKLESAVIKSKLGSVKNYLSTRTEVVE